jgi:Calx-beta domain-containing protein
MTIHTFSSVAVPVRVTLLIIATMLLLAMSVDVTAQQPSISVHDAVVTEGNSGTVQATFVVELSAPAPASPAVSFSYATSSAPDGTATAGSDYVATSGGPITFAAGETQKQVVVQVNGDTVDEQQEFFYLDISNVQNATVSSSRGKGFIVDDDGPTISINDVSITEGNSGTKAATFTLTLSGPSVEAIAVRVETAPGTATASSDYNSVNVVVLFQPGDVTHTVDVQVIGDTNLESNETFFVNITEAFATTIADGQGVGTILDDDILLALEQSGPTAQQAAAFESLLFTRDPFRVESIATWWGLPAGQNTIVMVFVQNLRLNQGENASDVIVNLLDGNGQTFNVPATDVRAVPSVDLTQVLFRLPDNLFQGTCNVTIKAHGQMSNTGTIRITP